MGRAHNQKARDKNKQKLPQVPKYEKSDGRDIEFSQELADHDDIEAQLRSKAADQRARQKRK
ncbi:YfhD family protein [Siminovitchia sp. 179-K 8D1 HS]|uniref:YfhD family protein n=1 Tax=Siminovitchia sp. 179-K 8D1 HS TaxID=3142385 RepID=UPI0039A0D7D4